jgi:hypothetical protein
MIKPLFAMKRILVILKMMLISFQVFGQTFTISGYMKDKTNGEGLIGATAYIEELGTGVVSNVYGFYSISLPKGNYSITYSYIGFESQVKQVDLAQNQNFNIMLEASIKEIEEVVISSERKDRNVESIDMSMEKLPVKMIQKLPSFMGEVDVIKSIQLLPGIQSGGEGSSGLYVRGGGPDENLMVLDEAPVYNASHMLGFFSVFNSDAIKDIQVYKGGIPAEYGGKISSVIDIRMNDGNSQQFNVKGGIGNISSRLTVEGPIIKDKWSYIISGRRTYADVVGKLVGIDELKNNSLYFYDLNGKSNVQLGKKDRIYLSAYTGDDYFKIGESMYMRWGNITGTLRWSHVFGEKLFSNTSLIYSTYDYNLGVPENTSSQFDWSSKITDYNFKEDLTWFVNPQNKLNIGLNIIHHHFEPGMIEAGEQSFYSNIELTQYNAIESAVYLANEQKIGSRITMKYGLRYSLFQQIGEGAVREYLDPENPRSDQIVDVKEYDQWELIGPFKGHFEPRLGIKYTLDRNSSLKASYNRMVQNLHLISNTNSPTPLDIWLPTSTYIKPLIADQIALGYFRNFLNNAIETSIEVYYKDMKNVIDYKDGAELFLKEDLETELLRGEGYSYGLEVLLKKQQGNLTGWIGYTLARSMRKVPGINEGKEYPSSYDRTHDVSVILSYALGEWWTLSANWVYATGNPTSYPASKYSIQGNNLYYYTSRNSSRIPDYHRLDLSATYDFKKNDHRRYKQSLNISLYNVYMRRNAYSVTFRQNADNPNISEAVQISIIGTIIPSITYNFSF